MGASREREDDFRSGDVSRTFGALSNRIFQPIIADSGNLSAIKSKSRSMQTVERARVEAMIAGNINEINLSGSSFEHMITDGNLYIDKTRMIERFLNEASDVQLIARQRRLGKSLNMDMLQCFLTDKADNRRLFKGLYIETSPMWIQACSAPAFYFDFKGLDAKAYRVQIAEQIDKHIYSYLNPDNLSGYQKRRYDRLINDPGAVTDGLLILTEIIYETTGKRSYLFIDEYDKLLTDNFETEQYEEIRAFETTFLSTGLKGNKYLKKALLTGVMRISHESMLSGLNNVSTYDVFSDRTYTDEYGLTDEEIEELRQVTNSDMTEVKSWYNGVKIGGKAIYNTYSVTSYLDRGVYECYWGKSGTLEMIVKLLNDNRKLTLAKLLNGETVEAAVDERISLKRLAVDTGDDAFYSLLVQAGYLALEERLHDRGTYLLTIPNKELSIVWKEFILKNLYSGAVKVRTLFDHADDPVEFARDLEYFLSDRLSYHDLAVFRDENDFKSRERVYHTFLLGILSAYEDVKCKYPVSNRESGDGRFDILVEKPDANFIFEFKACSRSDKLDAKAEEAMAQIETMRYGADLEKGKRLVKTGIAFYKKQCKVRAC